MKKAQLRTQNRSHSR